MYEQVNVSNYGSDSDNYFAAIPSDAANQLEPLVAEVQLGKISLNSMVNSLSDCSILTRILANNILKTTSTARWTASACENRHWKGTFQESWIGSGAKTSKKGYWCKQYWLHHIFKVLSKGYSKPSKSRGNPINLWYRVTAEFDRLQKKDISKSYLVVLTKISFSLKYLQWIKTNL